jgi:hypothetical protein
MHFNLDRGELADSRLSTLPLGREHPVLIEWDSGWVSKAGFDAAKKRYSINCTIAFLS